ncbi:hypothetical protein B808_20 [Fructilactobacillus florum 8D]|uniref:Regulatory protein YycH-like domain-containing protein n=2 Tax=Fructilactobacillus florum TaxID=640331 RepID=W9EN27_9LACO|nr:two-component system regulatory protein YycI [Fructilactobacillus florum]ETO41059.1 hypothetical protein B808_20 [Fructilactobacillus florum 8D]KRM91260.1 hypothetical protein FC87_GL000980 [Fructilactobacillus florum DSM 22689 = JCM 16035]
MNFKRIQEIFLLAFIVIDVFLYTMTKNGNIQSDDTNAGSAGNTIVKEMKRDSISVGTLSQKRTNGYYLSAEVRTDLNEHLGDLKNQNARVDNNTLISDFRHSYKLNPEHPEKRLNELIKQPGFVIDGASYHYDRDLSTATKVVYSQLLENQLAYSADGRLTFNVARNGQLTGYSQRELAEVKILHEKAELISEERAVISLYQYNEIPNNSKILWKKLAYSRLLQINGKDVYIPTWVIATKSNATNKNQVNRINAFNGAAFNTQKVNVANSNNDENPQGESEAK